MPSRNIGNSLIVLSEDKIKKDVLEQRELVGCMCGENERVSDVSFVIRTETVRIKAYVQHFEI